MLIPKVHRLNPIIIFICVSLCGYSHSISAQKFLQLEKRNSLKTMRFNIGDEITFRTKQGGKDWYTRAIWDLDREQGQLFLNNTIIKLEDITHVRTHKNRSWSKTIARTLQTNALTWVAYNGVDNLVYDGGDWGTTLVVAGASALISIPLELIFKWERHNVKTRKRLRIMDITF